MSAPADTSSRRPGFRPLAAALPAPARKAMKGRGLAQADIVLRWPEIVGETLARASLPERLRYPAGRGAGATLTVRVGSAVALELQHLAPLVIERINAFYGHAAVAALKLIQAPLPARAPAGGRAAEMPLTAEAAARLERALAGIEDADLKARLAALGRALAREGRG